MHDDVDWNRIALTSCSLPSTRPSAGLFGSSDSPPFRRRVYLNCLGVVAGVGELEDRSTPLGVSFANNCAVDDKARVRQYTTTHTNPARIVGVHRGDTRLLPSRRVCIAARGQGESVQTVNISGRPAPRPTLTRQSWISPRKTLPTPTRYFTRISSTALPTGVHHILTRGSSSRQALCNINTSTFGAF